MQSLESINFKALREIEEIRDSRAIVLSASTLEMSFLPQLLDLLDSLGSLTRLDVLLMGQGGEINAARRIALLLRQRCQRLSFLVPYQCRSSCTILALSGDEIVCGDLSIFSPIDPRLNADTSSDEQCPGSLASEDIRLFCQMSKDWFAIEDSDSRNQLLQSLLNSVFPTTLTSLYRSTKELKCISEELLAMHLPKKSAKQRESIIEHLMYAYHSHSYALTAENLSSLGLRISRNTVLESLSWGIAKQLNDVIGGGVRQTPQDPRIDVILASRQWLHVRQRVQGVIAPLWVQMESHQ